MNNKKKKSLLIIDDERDNISSLKAILGADYTVYASTNGKDAIETAEEFLPDIILLDILMPEMDGYDVIVAFKNSEKTRDIPVVFISGLDNINAEIKGLALGAVDYISKPFHPAIVKLRIKNHIQLIERLRQEELITKIAHNFLASSNTDILHASTLRMVGEFMGTSTILLFKIDKNNKTLICESEWINPELKLDTRIGDKIYFNNKVISNIINMVYDEKKNFFSSSDPIFKDLDILQKKYINNYIAMPILIKGNISAFLVFSKNENNSEWSKNETDFAFLVASIFSVSYERDSIQYAEYLSRAKSEFLSRMSHEMRTPMNAILGILQIFDVSDIPHDLKENCDIMRSSANILLRLIDNALDISDVEYGTFRLSDSAFDFKTVVWDLLQAADNDASKKRQLLDCKVDSAIPDLLYGDEKRLKHVINSLLTNAIKFTPEEGEIIFDARVVNEEKKAITVRVEVTDNGIGISKEQQDSVFSVFEQADSSSTREYGGIGLGLTLSKRIVEMMDGNIGVESELGKGSKFYFTCKMMKEST